MRLAQWTETTTIRPASPRLAVFVALLGLLLAACGTGGGATSEQAGSDSPAETTEAAATSAAEDTRSIEGAYGTTEVPADPQRVIVLHSSTILATALRVEAPVVATAFPPSGEGLVPYLPEEVGQLENVGWLPEFDLEKIASLDPDLIIGNTGFVGKELQPKLQEIAPTVAFEMFGDAPWKQSVRKVAAVFGRQDAVEQRIAAFEQRIAAFKQTMGDRLDSMQVTMAQIRTTDDIRIYTNDWCAGQVLEEAGIGRPQHQREAEEFSYIKLTQEQIERLDSDAIFYFVGASASPQEEAEEAAATITDNPLWTNLQAVQNGNAFQVDAQHWFTCGPVAAQNLILDDLEEHLASGNEG